MLIADARSSSRLENMLLGIMKLTSPLSEQHRAFAEQARRKAAANTTTCRIDLQHKEAWNSARLQYADWQGHAALMVVSCDLTVRLQGMIC